MTKYQKNQLDKNGSLGNKPRTGKYLKCKICGNEFYRKPFNLFTAKYCSYKCFGMGQRNRERKTCYTCGKIFERPVSNFKWQKIRGNKNFYCSKKCSNLGVGKQQKGKILIGENKIWSMRRADRIFSDFIRIRDNWKCRYCGKSFLEKSGQLHNSHFWSRRNWSTRFDENNCIALCYSCHKWKLETEKQGIYKQMMIDWLGQEKYNLLEKKSNLIVSKRDSIMEFMKLIKPYLKNMEIPKKRIAMIKNKDGQTYLD